MMAISPQDAKRLTAVEIGIVDEAEKRIDRELCCERRDMTFTCRNYTPRIMAEITLRYRAVGWVVALHQVPDQREGDYWRVTFHGDEQGDGVPGR